MLQTEQAASAIADYLAGSYLQLMWHTPCSGSLKEEGVCGITIRFPSFQLFLHAVFLWKEKPSDVNMSDREEPSALLMVCAGQNE